LITPDEIGSLKEYLTRYRQMAAGNDVNGVLARPVASVKRPESIRSTTMIPTC
jgi:hypothetical protein